MEYRQLVPFAVLISLDQITKAVAQSQGNVTWNRGVSFGVALPSFTQDFLVIGLVLVLTLGWFLVGKLGQRGSMGSVVFLAGAVSNVLDRIMFWAVRDWLPVPFTSLTNNLADWMITVGVIVLLGQILFPRLPDMPNVQTLKQTSRKAN